MCVALDVSPGDKTTPPLAPLPPTTAAEGGRGGHAFCPRADTLRYTHITPLGLKTFTRTHVTKGG